MKCPFRGSRDIADRLAEHYPNEMQQFPAMAGRHWCISFNYVEVVATFEYLTDNEDDEDILQLKIYGPGSPEPIFDDQIHYDDCYDKLVEYLEEQS